MSSTTSSPPPGGPLTTIFTPPASCFRNLPQPWPTSLCWSGGECYWTQPEDCYPTGAGTDLRIISDGPTVAKKYSYSPGVLPSGFFQAYPSWTSAGTTYAIGCIPNFLAGFGGSFCTSNLSPTTVNIPGQGVASSIIVILPQIGISWQARDLPLFTPASAPVLPGPVLTSYEASLAAQQTSTTSTTPRRTGSPSQTAGSASSQNDDGQSSSQSEGLSTGSKAGIGVGVAAAVLLLIAAMFIIIRRRKKRGGIARSDKQAYLDSKAELDNEGRQRDVPTAELPDRPPKELATHERPQELSTEREPPPIPLASKPRRQ